MEPPTQVSPHMPWEQTCSASHAVLQAPQLPGSFWRLMQLWPHWVEPPPQESAHAPFEQTSPPAHTLPQAPQLIGSICVLTQVPLQLSCPVGQLMPPEEDADEEEDEDDVVVPSLEELSPPEQLAAMSAARSAESANQWRETGKDWAITLDASRGYRGCTDRRKFRLG